MIVRLLRATVYAESGWYWHTEDIATPSWDDIETAVRRLDRLRYPFVWLFLDPDAAEDAVPDFDVIGGDNLYAVDCIADNTNFRFIDPTHGDKDIPVWLSDQGASFAEKYCSFSLDIVLQATRYFCEHGAPDPGLTWESRTSLW